MSVVVNTKPQVVQLRASEAEKKAGLTFADLCELVDQGREAGIAPQAIVHAKTWTKWDKKDNGRARDGYYTQYIEV